MTKSFQGLVIGMVAWTLSNTIDISLDLSRHFEPDAAATIWKHLVGVPLGIGFAIFGFVNFWRGLFGKVGE
jgi:hypothetical protein